MPLCAGKVARVRGPWPCSSEASPLLQGEKRTFTALSTPSSYGGCHLLDRPPQRLDDGYGLYEEAVNSFQGVAISSRREPAAKSRKQPRFWPPQRLPLKTGEVDNQRENGVFFLKPMLRGVRVPIPCEANHAHATRHNGELGLGSADAILAYLKRPREWIGQK